MVANPLYRRPPGEYERPAGALILAGLDGRQYPPIVTGWTQQAARGATQQPYQFDRCREGQSVLLELVCEPGNPHDRYAVAMDYLGQRVGYLPGTTAGAWHDLIRWENAHGRAVFTRGDLFVDHDLHRDERTYRGLPRLMPAAWIPGWEGRLFVMRDRGLSARIDDLLRTLETADQNASRQLLDGCWDGYDRELVKRVTELAEGYAEFSWPATPKRGKPEWEVPYCWAVHLRALMKEQRAGERAAEAEKSRVRRERKAAEKVSSAAARAESKAARRQATADRVADLTWEGKSAAQIASELGVSVGVVNKLRGEIRREHSANPIGARAPLPVKDGGTQARERIERASRALELQRAGKSYEQIARELVVSPSGIGDLLRDARFLEDPTSDSARLARAQTALAARQGGLRRAEYGSGLTKSKAEESWRDAGALTQVGAWPVTITTARRPGTPAPEKASKE